MPFIIKVFILISDFFNAFLEIWNFAYMLPDDSLLDRDIKILLRNKEDNIKFFEAINLLISGKTDSVEVTFSNGSTLRIFA